MKVQNENLGQILLPDFLLVGAAKSATSSLYSYLAQHPEIQMSRIKENWFFSFVDKPPQYTSPNILHNVVTRLEDYVKLFDGATETQCLGDASPSYLYTYQDTIKNIDAIYPPESRDKLRIIISLREPVSRAFSQYQTFKRVVNEPLDFKEATDSHTIAKRLDDNWNIFYDYTGFGCYYDQVKAYMDAFGKDKVLVILYDDIQKDPAQVCKSIYEFLGVDSSFSTNVSARLNSLSGEPSIKWIIKSIMSHNPIKRALAAFIPRDFRMRVKFFIFKKLLKRSELDETVGKKLVNVYAEEVERLEALINRDLSRWRHKT